MNQEYVHLCIVLDASGSMEVIEEDIKGSIKAFMSEQKQEEGKTVLDVFQFSNQTRRIVEHVDASECKEEFMDNYRCCGSTALNDAVCTAIDTLGREFAAMEESQRPCHVIFAIVTDGHENASREFTLDDVKERIDRQTREYNWEFVYLASDQSEFDARCISHSMGVGTSFSVPDKRVLSHCTRETLSQSLAKAKKKR